MLFGVFGFAALVGLFVFATHSGNSANKANSGVGTVVIWGTLPKADIQNALTQITQTDSTMKDVSYVYKDPANLPSDLASAIATGAAPDLVLASQEELVSLKKLLTPIPSTTLAPATFNANFVQEGQLFAVPDGTGYYGLPVLLDPLVLFSNTTILSSDGIAKPPATWEALTGLVPTISILTPTKQITRGLIALGTYDNVHNARAILSGIFQQVGVPVASYANGNLIANLTGTGTTVSTPGEAAVAFYTQFADPSKVSYTWNAALPDSQQAFLAGDLALYLGFASEARYFTNANPNLNFSVTTFPQPATSNTKSTYGLVYAFMIPRSASNSAGAFQAAALLTNPTEQGDLASATGLAPATLTPLSTAPSDPVMAIAYAEALYAHGWLSPAPSDTDAIFSSMINNVISGRLATGMALTTAASSLSALLQK